MQDDNLPKDRMIYVEDISNPENSVLINVDELESVKRFDNRPMFYTTDGPHPHNRGLTFVFTSGNSRMVDTKMTLREFEIERAKKFTPVAVPVRGTMVTHNEDGWGTETVNTVWEYYDAGTDHWYVALDLTDCLKQAQVYSGKYRATIDRRTTKEWRLGGE